MDDYRKTEWFKSLSVPWKIVYVVVLETAWFFGYTQGFIVGVSDRIKDFFRDRITVFNETKTKEATTWKK